jgi:transcriptional regulator with XRE-family HTH domain
MAKPTLPERVKERLRARRLDLGLTQEELCGRAGISLDAVSRIESGSRVPTLDTLSHLAAGLETTVAELVQDAKPDKPRYPRSIQRIIALLETEDESVQRTAEALIKALTTERKSSR